MLVAFLGLGEAGVVEAQRDDARIEPGMVEPVEEIVGAEAPDLVTAPHHLALPEFERDLAGDDHSGRSDALDQRAGHFDRPRGNRSV